MPPKPVPPLPAVNQETNAALSSTLTIASVGIATLNMLETLLPAAAAEVERESKVLADNFTTLIEHVNSQCNPPLPISEAIAGIIMGMQFQDRNTQIMENVTAILERYRNMLEEVCSNIESMRNGQGSNGHDIAEAVEHILSGIRLSDIRTRYMAALKKAKVHDSGDEKPDTGASQNEIELF